MAFAAGGSKGVKGKNLRLLLGKPLIAHSLAQARASGLFDLIAVSSDAGEILEASRTLGADLLIPRPDELASDTSAKVPAIRHAVIEAEARSGRVYDTLVDLDATAPLRTPEDIMENTTQLFLAVRFNCNHCHDHPFERWTQGQYYHLAAYFSQIGRKPDPAGKGETIGGSAVEGGNPLVEDIFDCGSGEVIVVCEENDLTSNPLIFVQPELICR